MAGQVKVFHVTEFLRATPEGRWDLEAASRILCEVVELSAPLDDFSVLLDTRGVQGALSAAELWHLSEKLAKHEHVCGRKTAVLSPYERFDHARFFALCAESTGCRVEAFDSYEEAMEWLLGEEATLPRGSP